MGSTTPVHSYTRQLAARPVYPVRRVSIRSRRISRGCRGLYNSGENATGMQLVVVSFVLCDVGHSRDWRVRVGARAVAVRLGRLRERVRSTTSARMAALVAARRGAR